MSTPLTTETVVVARCGAPSCTAKRYGTKQEPPVGFYGTVEHVFDDADGVTGQTVRVLGCTRAHLKKAIEVALDDPNQLVQEQVMYSSTDPGEEKRVHDRAQPEHESAGDQANNAPEEA